jgi:hypothetical protein
MRTGVAALIGTVLAATPAEARVHLGARFGEAPRKPEARAADPADAFAFGVAARGGYFGGPVLGGGLEAFARFGGWDLGVAGYAGSADLRAALQDERSPATEGFRVDEARLSSKLGLAFARVNVVRWVDLTARAGWRSTDGTLRLVAEDGSGTWSATAQASAAFVGAAVGTYATWTSGGFLGVDWVGLDVPVTSRHAVSTSATGTLPATRTSDLAQQAETLTRSLAQAPGLVLLSLAAGWRW